MNILIADSGSSKTDWRLITGNGEQLVFETSGLNPYYHSSESIQHLVEQKIENLGFPVNIERIYFYGSGCTDDGKCKIVSDALRNVFGNTAEIMIESDLLGAARACCQKDPGIVCILGTGSNSCFFDGDKIADQIPPLGFILGDEGSGTHIGKKILQSYFYREMPEKLRFDLQKKYDMNRSKILEQIYNSSNGNRFVAEFSRFAFEFRKDAFIKNLIRESLEEFIVRQVMSYEQTSIHPVCFAGSIAHIYREMVLEILNSRGLKAGVILQKPLPELVHYHTVQID